MGLMQLGEPPLHKIAKNIEKIQKNICYLSKVIRYKERYREEKKPQ
jgi:hypothetical protein